MDFLLTQSFLVVAETGSITEAANRLGLTQSALSRRIQQLEEQLGARLMNRSRHGISLTDIGELVLTEGQKLLRSYEALTEEIDRRQGLKAGKVRIGGGATAVSFILPEAIAEFQSEYQDIHFHMKEAGSAEIAQDVVNGELELGIVTMPIDQRELDIQQLIKDDIVLVLSHNHPLVKHKTINVMDLDGYSSVGFEGGTALRKLIDQAVQSAGIELNVVMELRSIPSILRMVATTGHLAFVSHLAAQSVADVVAMPVKGLSIQRKLGLISPRHRELSQAAQAFSGRLMKRNSSPKFTMQ